MSKDVKNLTNVFDKLMLALMEKLSLPLFGVDMQTLGILHSSFYITV
jgi:hypothetical protein